MNIVSKIFLLLIIMLFMTTIFTQESKAKDQWEYDEGGYYVTPDILVGGITPNADNSDAAGKMTEVVNRVLGFLQIASALLAVVVIAATGFRYIMETPDMKNELKKSMIPIIVGILLVFFAASIARFFVGMFQK